MYTVKKSVCERYEIKVPGSFLWANITISDDGDFNVISDYGNYSYAWRSFGDNFKKFLIEIGEKCISYPMSYLYSKIHNHAEANKVDIEATISKYKLKLFRMYRENRNSHSYTDLKEDVRECYESLCEIESEYGHTDADPSFFFKCMEDSRIKEELLSFEYYINDYVTTYDRQAAAFCEEIMPIFADILKNELQNEIQTQCI